jgi:hypothetical protein
MTTIIKILRQRNVNIPCLPVATLVPISNYKVERSLQDRRVMRNCDLPYITEEGLVLIDRREHTERRSVQCTH